MVRSLKHNKSRQQGTMELSGQTERKWIAEVANTNKIFRRLDETIQSRRIESGVFTSEFKGWN